MASRAAADTAITAAQLVITNALDSRVDDLEDTYTDSELDTLNQSTTYTKTEADASNATQNTVIALKNTAPVRWIPLSR